MNDVQFMFFLLMFLSFFTLLWFLGIPENLTYIEPFDVAIVGADIIAITTACVVATGALCAPVIAGFSLFSIYYWLVVSSELAKIIIFTPLIIVFLFVLSRLARGNG
jgi:hypothetical protein